MKSRIIIVLIGFIFYALQSNSKAKDTLFASELKPIGRTFINKVHDLELVSSGAHFGFTFKGTKCTIYVTIVDPKAHNYLQYELDGVYQKKIRINGNSKEPLTIDVPNSGQHSIWIYKATEAHTGGLMFSKITAQNIKSLSIPKRPLIEFIGNSITCGAAADDSEIPCGKGDYHDHHNAYMAYGPNVSRKLNANFILSSVSGIGIYRTWNRNSPGMPQVYENIDFQIKNVQKWDFKTYTPKIVSIALGTNDMSKGDGTSRAPFDTTTFISNYTKFVQLIKAKYPKAQIALLSSPMIKDVPREILQQCLRKVKKDIDIMYPKDKPVATFFFEPMEAHGCTGHPNITDHEILAKELRPFFERLMKQ